MKKFIMLALLTVMLSACTEVTEFGDCIGIGSKTEDPELIYEYNALNIAVGVILAETVIVPIVVLLDQIKCPVATTRVAVEQPNTTNTTNTTLTVRDRGLDDDLVVAIVGGIVLSLLSLAFVFWLVVKKFRIGFPRRK